ncbi:YbcC family protein [Tenacibaculum aestuariivivum]|uniref:YbcC family protein n=1 Tax=Tenacibaculum aestuariivivum TaxID=2006131 RepID=UPI003AB2660B
MSTKKAIFDEVNTLHQLKHFLPAQAPLKDFVHHNTLHAFQKIPFFEALQSASEIFGYKTTLSLKEFQELYKTGAINNTIFNKVIIERKGTAELQHWKELLLKTTTSQIPKPKIGQLRAKWKSIFKIDLDMLVHPKLFKLIGAYLDQGVSEKRFPYPELPFLEAVKELQKNSLAPIFKSKNCVQLLFNPDSTITLLLDKIIGNPLYYEQYLFDQQFSHPGWSGIIATIEQQPQTLLDRRMVTLQDFIFIELLLELEALEKNIGCNALPINVKKHLSKPIHLFSYSKITTYWEIIAIWQNAYEWTYHSQVLDGILQSKSKKIKSKKVAFQAFFCIDDREESIRRHLENVASNCETFGTPAHFGLEAMYQPDSGKFYTQICPGSLTPKHLIKEVNRAQKNEKDIHFNRSSHRLFTGWLLSQTIGFWSAVRLFLNLFRPRITPAHSSAFEHMEHVSNLTVKNTSKNLENGYKVGFTVAEMTKIVKGNLESTGLTSSFAPIIYLIGHGGSSTNNPYYAGYNCGACSGRPSSVNARAVAEMANRKDVRDALKKLNINIPKTTIFIGGLHDTTRDEVKFYDETKLNKHHQELHKKYQKQFETALANNAKERARQFLLTNIKQEAYKVHKDVKNRSTALFEPRPELNHSNNTLCIVGNRTLTKNVFLDQRAFLNSYDYKQDINGEQLNGILGAATPVCGGINLEYYFSRVDNQKLGAGSKLPHNVIGLFGVSNGIKGDLRTGLPSQMIDVHAPLRLMMIVEHYPDIVMQVIQNNNNLLGWYNNEWLKLAVIHPETMKVSIFNKGKWEPYKSTGNTIAKVTDLMPVFENESSNLPVYQINTH